MGSKGSKGKNAAEDPSPGTEIAPRKKKFSESTSVSTYSSGSDSHLDAARILDLDSIRKRDSDPQDVNGVGTLPAIEGFKGSKRPSTNEKSKPPNPKTAETPTSPINQTKDRKKLSSAENKELADPKKPSEQDGPKKVYVGLPPWMLGRRRRSRYRIRTEYDVLRTGSREDRRMHYSTNLVQRHVEFVNNSSKICQTLRSQGIFKEIGSIE